MSEAKGERERLVVDTRSARSLIGYEDPANTITATVQRSSFPERVIFTTRTRDTRMLADEGSRGVASCWDVIERVVAHPFASFAAS